MLEKLTEIESGSFARMKKSLVLQVFGIISPEILTVMDSLSDFMFSSGEYSLSFPAQISIVTIYKTWRNLDFVILIILADLSSVGFWISFMCFRLDLTELSFASAIELENNDIRIMNASSPAVLYIGGSDTVNDLRVF
jgi:hypothetical protein